MPAPFQPPACDPYGKWPQSNSYGYKPSLAAGIIFSLLFGFFSIAQLLQAIRFRSFWLLALFFVAGCALECAGWVARTVQSKCVYGHELFVMQTATLIMGPAWVQAGIYVTLWCYITILGRACSPVPPKIYLWAAFCFDCVALGLQAAGGGLAGTAYDNGESTQTATTIMVIGIIAQLAGGVAFSIILSIVLWRAAAKIRTQRLLVMFATAMAIAMAMMITRGVYRTIELLQGWRGTLITTQAYIIALDAVPMVIAFGALTIVNPAKIWNQKEELKGAVGTSATPNEKITDLESGSESNV